MRYTAYGRPALETLREFVAHAKRDDAMAPVTVLVPNNIAGIVARRFLAQGLSPERQGIAAIRFTTLRHLADQLAGPVLASAGRRPAASALTAAAVRACLEDSPGRFARVAEHPATARALAMSHRALRDVDPRVLATLAGTSSLTADVIRLHLATRERLMDAHYDATDLLHTATHLVRDGVADINELGTLVLYVPQDLDRAENRLLRELARSASATHVVAAVTGVPRADSAVRDAVTATELESSVGSVTVGRVQQPTAGRVLTASDSDDEVRCVVREVVAALRTTPAHRSTKIIYQQEISESPHTSRELGLSSAEHAQLPDLQQGEGLWRVGQRSFVVRHITTENELHLFDTNARMSIDR